MSAVQAASNLRPSERISLQSWLALGLLCLACTYIWIVPLFKPHGIYFWGHYRLPDIYIGVPLLLATISLILVLRTPVPQRRRRALQLTTSVTAIIISLYGLDVLYVLTGERLFNAPHTDLWYYGSGLSTKDNLPDRELGFVRRPGIFWRGEPVPGAPVVTYRTDEHGFRNPPGLRQADVVFLGDSFTEAASVPEEHSFVQNVARETGLSVANLGRNYHGPPQELIILRRYGLPYHPRAIVWQIFEGNDLMDAADFTNWQRHPERRQTWFQRYASRSFFARILPTVQETQWPSRPFRQSDGSLGKVHLDYCYIPDAPARYPLGWEETALAIESGYRLCQSQGLPLLIVFVPIKARVLGPYVPFLNDRDRDNWLPGGSLDDKRDFGTVMAALCRRLNCPFIDLTPALRRGAAKDNQHIFFTNSDTHLDVDGNKIVADVVSRWLRSHSLTKAPK